MRFWDKVFKVLLIVLFVLTPDTNMINGITVLAANNPDELPPGTYTIGGIQLTDIGNQPTSVRDAESLLMREAPFDQRTGWSAYVLVCDYHSAYDSNGKKKMVNGMEVNPWKKMMTGDSGHQDRQDVFGVTGMENKITAALSASYGPLAGDLLSYMKANGIQLGIESTTHRVGGSSDGIRYSPGANSAHCSEGDEGFFYQDNDVYLTATFVIEDTIGCEDVGYFEDNPEECDPQDCTSTTYAEANPEECEEEEPVLGCEDPGYYAANQLECNPPYDPCFPITRSNIESCSGEDEKYNTPAPTPELYTELKHNTVHQEEWEAMAGIPTTENLYYSVGGSEYMVEVELTSRKGNVVTRNYKYEYTPVLNKVCEHDEVCYEWVYSGMSSRPSPPNPPKTGLDLSGQTLSQTWETSKYCVRESCSTDEDGGESCECVEYNYDGWWEGYDDFVGGSTYTWSQDIFFDYVEITKAKVWRIDNGVLYDMNDMTAEDTFKAEIKLGTSDGVISHYAGHPGNAETGRLRYSFERPEATMQSGEHGFNFSCKETSSYDFVDCTAKADAKTIGNGTRDGAELNDSCTPNDGYICISEDFYMFGEGTRQEPQLPGVMAQKNKVTVLSDVLVLSTQDGYQSVIYFEQNDIPETENLVTNFEYEPVSGSATWGSNKNIDTWDHKRPTTVVSYNGMYYDLENKYRTQVRRPNHGRSGVPNTLRNYSAAHPLKDTLRQSKSRRDMEIYVDGIDIIDTFGNGEFQPGASMVEYVPIYEHNAEDYADTPTIYPAKYRTGTNQINKVLIHNPIGVKYAYVMGTHNTALDRRTGGSGGASQGSFNTISNGFEIEQRTGAAFVSLEGRFDIYFPNIGDFPPVTELGLPNTTEQLGPMYHDYMDTTLWTRNKWVVFPVDVVFGGTHYAAGSEIDLDVETLQFTFYVPLNNNEMATAPVEFWAEAINAEDRSDPGKPEAEYLHNPSRGNLVGVPKAAQHRVTRTDLIDVVGNIGNLVIEDTGDFRWSSYFKKPVSPLKWFVKDIVPEVDPSQQNRIMGDQVDIFLCQKDRAYGGSLESADCIDSGGAKNLNSHDVQSQKQLSPEPLALTQDKNPITQLKNQPVRLGYQIYTDLETTGNYGEGNVDIDLKYYMLNLETGAMQHIDLYANIKKKYQKIYDGSKTFSTLTQARNELGNSPVSINWSAEKVRRNVTPTEDNFTNAVGGIIPNGWDYIYGNTQKLLLEGRNRTYVGNTNKRGVNQSLGGRPSVDFYGHGQRWHFHAALPSSTVAVKVGEPVNEDTLAQFKNDKFVIVVAADIQANGDVWSLGYEGGYSKAEVTMRGYPTRTITPGTLPGPSNSDRLIITVFTPNNTVADDLEISGTH